jgi:hypothetical protein
MPSMQYDPVGVSADVGYMVGEGSSRDGKNCVPGMCESRTYKTGSVVDADPH